MQDWHIEAGAKFVRGDERLGISEAWERAKHDDYFHYLFCLSRKILKDPRERPDKLGRIGVNNYSAVLNPAKVRAMRKLREDGWLYRELAVKFKVALQTAQAVCNHLTWQHVD